MKIILMGIQGCGKSTQGNLLSKRFGIAYLSTGHIFRDIAREKTKWGRYVKETLNAGYLIPDQKTVPIVEAYLQRKDYKKGYILDGFPRTLNQAKKFKEKIDRVFYIKVTDKEALWRLAYRNDVIREDDTIKAIRKRIEIFHKFTKPVVAFYKRKGILVDVNGEKKIKEVNQQILRRLPKKN